MKDFIIKHKRIIMLSAILLVFSVIFTTAGLTSSRKSADEVADSISTCSTPTGSVVARGIDISRYQGEVDFEKLKSEGIDFVILRVGISGGKDTKFEEYYEAASTAGLDIGCYFYTYSLTSAEAKADAEEVLEYIQGKSFTYPVFFDFEYPELLSYDRIEENTEMIDTFCKYIKRGGYYPGVYTSTSIYDDFMDSSSLGNKWDFWIAHYIDGTSAYEYYNHSFSMWQYSSTGTVEGISNDVDLDVSYVNYPEIIAEFQRTLEKYAGF
jgi:GH25 family lysozyme M1 (1,4-beta-N-acetylmuramidase)